MPPEPEPEPEPGRSPRPRRNSGPTGPDRGRVGAQPRPQPRSRRPSRIRRQVYAEIHEDLAAIGEGIRELSAQMEAEDARRAEAQQEMLSEPSPWQQPEAQAQAGLEPSWQPGEAVADASEAAADMDMEAEI